MVEIHPLADADEELYCSVTISCKKPAKDGSMEVELTYAGDRVAVAYLLESAREMLSNCNEQ